MHYLLEMVLKENKYPHFSFSELLLGEKPIAISPGVFLIIPIALLMRQYCHPQNTPCRVGTLMFFILQIQK